MDGGGDISLQPAKTPLFPIRSRSADLSNTLWSFHPDPRAVQMNAVTENQRQQLFLMTSVA